MAEVGRLSLGSQGLEVSAQGLGCMGMSYFYGPPKPEAEMIDLIRYAVSRGVTFLDTSDVYGPYTNEILLGKAIKGIRDKVQIATKFGMILKEGGSEFRGDAAYVRASCEGSLKRLDVDYIDLYYQHRVDTRVPIEETVSDQSLSYPLLARSWLHYCSTSDHSSQQSRLFNSGLKGLMFVSDNRAVSAIGRQLDVVLIDSITQDISLQLCCPD